MCVWAGGGGGGGSKLVIMMPIISKVPPCDVYISTHTKDH